MTERPPSSDADGSWEAWTDLRPNTPEEQARIDRAAAIKSWFQPSPDQHPAPAAVPPSSDAAGWKSAIGSGNSRTVFDFPDGTTGPGTWDPKTQTIVKAYSTDTIEGPSSDAGSPIDVDDLGLSDEQTAILRKHLASRRQTVAEFFGDVLMEYGLGRATGKEYPPPATDAASELGRLLAERDRLISEGVDPTDLLVPEPLAAISEGPADPEEER